MSLRCFPRNSWSWPRSTASNSRAT